MENDVKDEFQRDVRSQDDVIEEDCQGGGRGKRARRPKKAFLWKKRVGEKGISEKGFMRKKRGQEWVPEVEDSWRADGKSKWGKS